MDFCGWEGNNWDRTDGSLSKYFNKYGPKSDWNSVSGKPGYILILTFQNKKCIILLNKESNCALPYCLDGSSDPEYYCTESSGSGSFKTCGKQVCPILSDSTNISKCKQGNSKNQNKIFNKFT